MKYPKRHIAGFSLIEAIVSITLLVVAITGPLALSSQSLRASREAKNELEAVHLAEEGIEIVRSVRDNNSSKETDLAGNPTGWLKGIVKLTGASDICEAPIGCSVDSTSHQGSSEVWGNTTLKKCQSATNCPAANLYKNTTTGIYRQSSAVLTSPDVWQKSDYTRRVTVSVIDSSKKARVTSVVTYKSVSGETRTITASTELYNWFPCIDYDCPI